MSQETFRVERSAHIDAAPDAIAPLIIDFRQWMAWSPFDKMDPAAERTYSGAATGVGAVYEYAGKKAGAGRLAISEVRADGVRVRLEFLKPFKATNTADFRLEREGAGTRVTWAMHGPNTLASKVMGLFISTDKFLGGEFEKGLADLKRLAERTPVAA
jgi:hypothetical protein